MTEKATVAKSEIEVSVVMPCLNEAETLEKCIRKAQACIDEHSLSAEIIIADNGSNDGSQSIAERCGARVVPVAARGYGSALRAGIEAACGKYVVMGDADDSYDFTAFYPMIERLRSGAELVMGNRFKGGIMPGAMPWKHKWIGNPVLTTIGRVFFRCPCSDFHCGLRAISKEAYSSIELVTTGMEFASEMVIKATLRRKNIEEVPIILYKDGRSRPPHLRSWHDGWRHLRFMLLYSPNWLFIYPGFVLVLLGLLGFAAIIPGPRVIGHITLDVHTLMICSTALLVGFQTISFGIFGKLYAVSRGLLSSDACTSWIEENVTLERSALMGLLLIIVGLATLIDAVAIWSAMKFGALNYSKMMRLIIPSMTMAALGVQVITSSFFLSLLKLDAVDVKM
ncbi:MAG: glycosyltransferase family 2 protein [Armatimonadetes bacterium]|nr:glycosyltransferase family 2 protein [Armatimonadota bacterium]